LESSLLLCTAPKLRILQYVSTLLIFAAEKFTSGAFDICSGNFAGYARQVEKRLPSTSSRNSSESTAQGLAVGEDGGRDGRAFVTNSKAHRLTISSSSSFSS